MDLKDIELPPGATSEEIWQVLDEFGVCVLPSYFGNQVNQWRTDLVNWIKNLNTGLTDDPKTWDRDHMPLGPREGMMQSLVSNAPTMWEMRLAMNPLFSKILEVPQDELITSLDGSTILPPVAKQPDDWPHVDQTRAYDKMVDPNGGVVCIQGQIVLNESDGGFRCSPKSHLLHKLVCSTAKSRNSDFHRQPKETQDEIKMELERIGGLWQVPILAPAGSVILWRSATIHSARPSSRNYTKEQNAKEKAAGIDNPYCNWRMTVYICQRPKYTFDKKNLIELQQAAENGRMTNHWATKVFNKKPSFSRQPTNRTARLEALLDNPAQLVDPQIMANPNVRNLLGYRN